MRRWPVQVLLVLLYLASAVVLAFQVVLFIPEVHVHVSVQVPDALLPGGTVHTVTTSVDVPETSDRAVLWLGLLPATIVALAAFALLIQVVRATLAGDAFQPRTLRALNQLGLLLAAGGTVAAIVTEQVQNAVARRVGGFDTTSITLPFQWLIAGLFVSLVALIVAEGVRRSAPVAPYLP